MRPSFCVDLQTFSVHCGRTVCKVAYVWGRFRLGLTLDYTVFCVMYLCRIAYYSGLCPSHSVKTAAILNNSVSRLASRARAGSNSLSRAAPLFRPTATPPQLI